MIRAMIQNSHRGQANFSACPVWTHSETTSQTQVQRNCEIMHADTKYIVCTSNIKPFVLFLEIK